MKKIVVLTALIILLTGCSSEKASDSSSLENIEIIETNSISASDTETPPTDWRSAYREELIKCMNDEHYSYEIPMFSLYDINDDDIPELFIPSGAYHAAGCNIYTFTDKLVSLGEFGSWGTCIFYPDKNILCGAHTGQGENISIYYQIDNNGTLSKLESFYDNSGMVQVTEEYKVNDVEVTEEEYKEAKNKYFDNNRKYLGHDFILNETFIGAALNEEPDWKECYKNLLYGSQDLGDNYRFSLYDVTGDSIPELFITDGYICRIYSFRNSLISFGKFGIYGVEYSPSHDLFYRYDIQQGHEYFLYDRLNDDNNFQHEMTFYNNVGAAPSEDDISYQINYEEVSYEEYRNALDEYVGIDDFISLGYDYCFTESDILKALR